MNNSVYRRTTCRLCSSDKVKSAVEFAPTPAGDKYVSKQDLDKDQEIFPLALYLCEECGAVQLLDVVNPEILYGDYIYQTSISLGLPEHFLKSAENIVNFVKPGEDSLVIDIGSNDGTFLKCFKKLGLSVLGVDPAPSAAKKANDDGVETINAFFDQKIAREIKVERGEISIITANNVFANIDNLDGFIEGVKELMSENSCFVFETGYAVDLVEGRLIDVVYHEHLSYFSVKSLDKFFRKHSMKIVDAQHIKTKGGSIRCIVQLADGNIPVSSSVKELIVYEDDLGIDRMEKYNDLSKYMDDLKNKLTDVLNRIKADGKSVAGYGASVGVTTLIYLWGLDDKLDYIVDDNPVRKGLFTPGHHIPVLSSDEIYERNPDVVLILAWRYCDPIIKKHQKFIDGGGKFIVPLPELRTI